jgi:hypothetical protein
MRALATQQTTDLAQAQREAIGLRVALNSNLAGMSDADIWQYYCAMCDRLALDPMSHPFDIITTTEKKREKKTLPNGKTDWVDVENEVKKLYPNSSCTSQLGETRGYNYSPVKIEAEQSLIALGMKVARVSVEIIAPDGRTLVGESFIDLMSGWEGKALSGNNLQNALKKAATQARRRGTLQMAGLAIPPDSVEISTLGAIEQAPDQQVTFETVMPPLQIEAPQAAVSAPQTATQHLTPEQRAAAPLPVEMGGMTAAEILRAEIRELCESWPDTKQMGAEVSRQLAAFNVQRIAGLTDEQLPKLKEGLQLWIQHQRNK